MKISLVELLEENRRLRIELDAAREELAAERADKFAVRGEQLRAAVHGNLVSSKAVMSALGYKSGPSFWRFVHSKNVPHVQINARKIMFDPAALNRWLEKRDTSGKPLQLTFGAEANHSLPAA